MARAPLVAVARDRGGNAIANALVRVYLEGTSTPVSDMFAAETGGSAITTLTSDATGQVSAWFDTPKLVDLVVTDNGNAAYNPGAVGTLDFADDDPVTVTVSPRPEEVAQLDEANTWAAKQTFSGEIEVDGAFNHDGSTFGAGGATPTTVPAANTTDLKDLLAALGFITNGGATPLNLDAGTLTSGKIVNQHTATNDLAIDFQSDSGDGRGMRTRWSAENNSGQATIDLNIRDAVLNVGEADPANSADGTSVRIFLPTGGTGNAFQVFKRGEGGLGQWMYMVSGNGTVQQRGVPGTQAYMLRPADIIAGPNAIVEILSADGTIQWGATDGTSAPDAGIKRTAADTVGTLAGDSFYVAATLEVDGPLDHDGSTVGFYGVTPATRPAATDDIKDALTTLGLLQGTSASPLNLDGGALTAAAGTFTGRVVTSTITTFTDLDATPSVSAGNIFKTANSGATSISTFDDGVAGQEILVIFTDANTSIVESGNVRLSAAFTSSADDTMRLIYDGTNWFEVSRSVN